MAPKCKSCADIEAGTFPQSLEHCSGPGGCCRTWRSDSSQLHCAEPDCHRHFGSQTAYDIHRAGGECRDPATLFSRSGKPRLRLVQRKYGLVFVKYDDRPPPLTTRKRTANREGTAA